MCVKEEKKIANVGDLAKCPQCGRTGHVIWISLDGKRAGIQCHESHSQMGRRPGSKFGSSARPQTKPRRNMVFLIEIK